MLLKNKVALFALPMTPNYTFSAEKVMARHAVKDGEEERTKKG